MKTNLTFLLFFTLSLLNAQELPQFFTQTDQFLQAQVKDGKIDYKSIHKDHSQLDAILEIAKGISLDNASEEEYQAFWINAYNLSVIKGIINNYPTNSPLDDSGFFDKTTYELAGKNITLNDIENKLLREKYKDARFHFVLVCGAIGCPPIIDSAYFPETLEQQLENQTKQAINGNFLKVNAKKKRVEVSEIMKWYKEDFVMNGQTEIDFINAYRAEPIPDNYKLQYFTYNWNLNKQ